MSTAEFPVTGPVLVLDPFARDAIVAQRRASGADRYDEVWEGTYFKSPLPSLEHQRLLRRLTVVFDQIVENLGKGEMFPGANLTDRVENWETNFRCPDIVVVLDETRLKNLDSAIVGGPDFLIEIASPGDRWPEKLPFYASIGVRELLILNRDTRHLELFRLTQGVMNTVDTSNRSEATELTSEVLPLSFQWVQKSGKPKVTIERNDGQQGQWIV